MQWFILLLCLATGSTADSRTPKLLHSASLSPANIQQELSVPNESDMPAVFKVFSDHFPNQALPTAAPLLSELPTMTLKTFFETNSNHAFTSKELQEFEQRHFPISLSDLEYGLSQLGFGESEESSSSQSSEDSSEYDQISDYGLPQKPAQKPFGEYELPHEPIQQVPGKPVVDYVAPTEIPTTVRTTTLTVVPVEPVHYPTTGNEYAAPSRPVVPANEYLPPLQPLVPATEYLAPSRPVVPANEYLPPMQPIVPANEYVAPSRPVVPANEYLAPSRPVVPANEYLPPSQPVVPTNEYYVPVRPATEYLAPSRPVVPANEYLTPSQPAVPAHEYLTSYWPVVPANEYLAPQPIVPANEYLSPPRPVVPANEYLAPQPIVPANEYLSPPRPVVPTNEYLAPQPIVPANEYLSPSQHFVQPTTTTNPIAPFHGYVASSQYPTIQSTSYGYPWDVQYIFFVPVPCTSCTQSYFIQAPNQPNPNYIIPNKPTNDYGTTTKPVLEYAPPDNPTLDYGRPRKPVIDFSYLNPSKKLPQHFGASAISHPKPANDVVPTKPTLIEYALPNLKIKPFGKPNQVVNSAAPTHIQYGLPDVSIKPFVKPTPTTRPAVVGYGVPYDAIHPFSKPIEETSKLYPAARVPQENYLSAPTNKYIYPGSVNRIDFPPYSNNYYVSHPTNHQANAPTITGAESLPFRLRN